MEKGAIGNYKKGQVSIFIILAILIVLTVVVYFIFNSENLASNLNERRVNPVIRPIYNMVKGCLASVGEDGIEEISLRGGSYTGTEFDTELEIPYYIFDGRSYVPRLEEIEGELSLYVLDNMGECLDFESFNEFEIDIGSVGIDSMIDDNGVLFDMNYQLSIKKDSRTYEIENFETLIPVRLETVYNTASSIVLNEIDELEFICISCTYDLTLENDLFANTINFGSDTIIYSIIDKNSKINDENFVYNFAIQFEG